jgi:translation elongation factor EF-Ts
MCPEAIGDPEKDEPNADPESENVLIFQEFLLDTTLTVGNILQENESKVLDYVRFECGETPQEEEKKSLLEGVQ